MSISNLLIPNNLPIKGGGGTVGSIESETTGYPIIAFPGTQVNALLNVTDIPSLEAGDYLISYKVGINTASTTAAQNLGMSAILAVERTVPPLNQAIDINTKLLISSVGVPPDKITRYTFSGSVVVRLTEAAKINLSVTPTSSNDIPEAEIFVAPNYGITAQRIKAVGTFETL